jgi:hypothetical protein
LSTPAATNRPTATTAHRVVLVALPVLVLVQAALAGQHLFEGQDLIELHGYLGIGTFVLALVGLGTTLLVRGSDAVDFGLAVALAALAFAQIGLGYVGRETLSAAAWHIPLGVTIFGLRTFQLSLLRR